MSHRYANQNPDDVTITGLDGTIRLVCDRPGRSIHVTATTDDDTIIGSWTNYGFTFALAQHLAQLLAGDETTFGANPVMIGRDGDVVAVFVGDVDGRGKVVTVRFPLADAGFNRDAHAALVALLGLLKSADASPDGAR